MQDDPQTARQIRALYNYEVGQKAALGTVMLIIGIAAGAVYFLATAVSTAHHIFEGLRQLSAH